MTLIEEELQAMPYYQWFTVSGKCQIIIGAEGWTSPAILVEMALRKLCDVTE